jgi:hypothetical protein
MEDRSCKCGVIERIWKRFQMRPALSVADQARRLDAYSLPCTLPPTALQAIFEDHERQRFGAVRQREHGSHCACQSPCYPALNQAGLSQTRGSRTTVEDSGSEIATLILPGGGLAPLH